MGFETLFRRRVATRQATTWVAKLLLKIDPQRLDLLAVRNGPIMEELRRQVTVEQFEVFRASATPYLPYLPLVDLGIMLEQLGPILPQHAEVLRRHREWFYRETNSALREILLI